MFMESKDSQYQQVGNAVSTILAEAIAPAIISIIKRRRGSFGYGRKKDN